MFSIVPVRVIFSIALEHVVTIKLFTKDLLKLCFHETDAGTDTDADADADAGMGAFFPFPCGGRRHGRTGADLPLATGSPAIASLSRVHSLFIKPCAS